MDTNGFGLKYFLYHSLFDREAVSDNRSRLAEEFCLSDTKPPSHWPVMVLPLGQDAIKVRLLLRQTAVDSDFSQNFCVKIRWVEALFLCYLTLFTQASMNLRNGHNVTQVDFDSYRTRI